MISSCVCRKPQQHPQHGTRATTTQHQPPHGPTRMSHREGSHSEEVLVETVTDEEDTVGLLPITADTMADVHLPPTSGVVYMFPRAWKERAMAQRAQLLGKGSNDNSNVEHGTETRKSFIKSYCTIS